MKVSRPWLALVVGGLVGLAVVNPQVYAGPRVAAQVAESAPVAGKFTSLVMPAPETDSPTAETIVGPSDAPPASGPSPTSIPTPVIGTPPLVIEQAASVANAVAGVEFSYSLLISSSSASARTVQVQARIDEQIAVTDTVAGNGSCSGDAPVVCTVRAQQGRPATIVIGVRVRPDARTDTRVVGQSLAQDDEYNTAATEQVFVEIVAATAEPGRLPREMDTTPTLIPPPPDVVFQPPAENADPKPQEPATPEPAPVLDAQAPAPSEGEDVEFDEEDEQGQPPAQAPAAELQPPTAEAAPPPLAPTPQPAEAARGAVEVLPTAIVLPTAAPAVSPAPANPVQPQPALSTARPSVPLPNTAATTPAIGSIVALLGLALIVRGARRVRRAGARLAGEGAGATELGPLLRAIAIRQRAAATTIAEMEQRSRRLAERLESVEAKRDA